MHLVIVCNQKPSVVYYNSSPMGVIIVVVDVMVVIVDIFMMGRGRSPVEWGHFPSIRLS